MPLAARDPYPSSGIIFFQKKVPMFRDLSEKWYPFLVILPQKHTIQNFLGMRTLENFKNQTHSKGFLHEKRDPCLGISFKKTKMQHISVCLNLRVKDEGEGWCLSFLLALPPWPAPSSYTDSLVYMCSWVTVRVLQIPSLSRSWSGDWGASEPVSNCLSLDHSASQ